jgi:hypothetical protein
MLTSHLINYISTNCSTTTPPPCSRTQGNMSPTLYRVVYQSAWPVTLPQRSNPTKRRSKPNSRSLAAFSTTQSPIRLDKRRKQPAPRPTNVPTLAPAPTGPQATLVPISSTLIERIASSPPTVRNDTPIPARRKRHLHLLLPHPLTLLVRGNCHIKYRFTSLL